MTMVEATARGKLATLQLGAFSLMVLLAVVATTGCGGDGLAEVSGTVTVDGVPAKVGAVTFIPTDGTRRTAGGQIVDGAYTARVPPGMCKVEVRVSKVIGERRAYAAPDAPVKQVLTEALPPKFNDLSELSLDVQPGANKKDYALQSK